jgi:geranylgeranyl diphosphate synthase type II
VEYNPGSKKTNLGRDEREVMKRTEEISKMVDSYLRLILKKIQPSPEVLKEGIRYALFPGGKRLRPILCLSSYFASGGRREEEVLPFACALEMIHSFSLIHDDLPAIDNDAMRRGKPTLHRVFGEGMAILIGDALLTLAFETLFEVIRKKRRECFMRAYEEILFASEEMVRGQIEELASRQRTLADYLKIIEKKTGSLFTSSLSVGAILAGLEEKKLLLLKKAAHAFGIAFQLSDDICDNNGAVSLCGRKKTEDMRKRYQKKALLYLTRLGKSFSPLGEFLRSL